MEKNLVSILHDADVMNAYQHAFEQLDYFKMQFDEDSEKKYEFYVKIGFPQSSHKKGPVIPILTLDDEHIDNEEELNIENEPVNIDKEEVHTEWMWMLIKNWEGSKISGVLSNEPAFRKDLKPGSEIEFSQKAIMDWLIEKNGELVEGNFLKKILETKGKPIDNG